MIDFIDVEKTYASGVEALKGINLTIEDGEFVFVIGKSGSGKSTLLKCITCEERPTSGKVTIDNFDISHMSRALVPHLRRKIGMIYQDFRLIETKTVAENVAFAGEIIGVPKQSLNNTVQICLSVVGLKEKADCYPQELSGGEQQRVAIARAMVNNPSLIVADEPTGNLDPETSEAIMAMLLEINRNGHTTVIICTHDSAMVDRMKQRVIEIEDGLITRDEKDSGYKGEQEHETYQPQASRTSLYGGEISAHAVSFGDDAEYGDDYDDICALKSIADEKNISIMLVHHLRKTKDSDDPFNQISGSTGITGAVDTAYLLKRTTATSDTATHLPISRTNTNHESLPPKTRWKLVKPGLPLPSFRMSR